MNIRPVTRADIPGLARLTVERGFPERSEAGWDWVLFHNPEQAHSPAGYVVEKDGEIAAFIGGSGHRLHGTGTSGFVVIAHTFVADPSRAGYAPRLIRHGVQNGDFDASYTLHNNALSAPIYKRFGSEAVWQASGRQYLKKRRHWISILLSAGLRRLARIKTVKTALTKREWFSKRPRKGPSPLAANVQQLDPFSRDDAEAIDALDRALAASGKIIGSRAAHIWRYRLSDPDRAIPTELFAIYDEEGIAALLATSISKDDELSVMTLDIEDLVFRPGCEQHLETLLHQAKKCARHARAARIMWRVLPPNLDMATAEYLGFKLRPRSYDSCHFRGLADWNPLNWELSPFDGDFWFALRRPPTR